MAAGLHCQKCRTPLRLDSSLEDLNPASFKILADAAPKLRPSEPDAPRSVAARERKNKYDEVSRQAGPPIHKRTTSGSQRLGSKMAPDMSYIMLTESQLGPEEPPATAQTPTKRKSKAPTMPEAQDAEGGDRSVSQQMDMTVRLFEILSSHSDIDHPICSECTELLLDAMQKRQASVIRERDAYVGFLKKAQEDVPTDEEKAQTELELQEIHRREKRALEQLELLEAEKAKLEEEIAAVDAEAEELDAEEEQFWRERNANTAELTAFQEERDSLQMQLTHDTELLESLQRRNVYNDTFNIGHDGTFGTINGLRLGRLPDHPVDWSEINAAWGQALLLLSVVSAKLGYKFQEYRLLPVGSTSKIVKYDGQQAGSDTKQKGTILELFSSGSLPLNINLFHGRMDDAMIAFLDCLRLVGQHVEKTSARGPDGQGLKMPYTIRKDKIDGVSIRLPSFGQDEQWTRACKFTLTCCKFLLAHASHIDDARTVS